MNWKVLASDSVSLAFRESIKFYNSLWKKGLGPYPPYVAGEYVWQDIRLIPGTNIIILIPTDYQDGTYGVIGEFDGWKYVQPILITCIAELHRYLNVVSNDIYKALVHILSEHTAIVADYSILTTDIPDPILVASKY